MDGIKKPKAVLFDWDGTLVDTLPGIRAAHQHVRREMGLPPYSEEEFMAAMKHSSRELFPALYGREKGQAAMDLFYGFISEHSLKYLTILPDSRALLEALKQLDLPAALVSNKRHDMLLHDIAHTALGELFYTVVGAGQAPRDKPAPDLLLLALTKSPVALEPEEVWYVGDHEPDMRAARAAGCRAVLIKHGKDKQDLIDRFSPYLTVNDCRDLINVLEKSR